MFSSLSDFSPPDVSSAMELVSAELSLGNRRDRFMLRGLDPGEHGLLVFCLFFCAKLLRLGD